MNVQILRLLNVTIAGKLLCEGHTTSCESHNCNGTFCTAMACGYKDHSMGTVHGCVGTCSVDGCTNTNEFFDVGQRCDKCGKWYCTAHCDYHFSRGVTCDDCRDKETHELHSLNCPAAICAKDGCISTETEKCVKCGEYFCSLHLPHVEHL
jgi:hypothetical protein